MSSAVIACPREKLFQSADSWALKLQLLFYVPLIITCKIPYIKKSLIFLISRNGEILLSKGKLLLRKLSTMQIRVKQTQDRYKHWVEEPRSCQRFIQKSSKKKVKRKTRKRCKINRKSKKKINLQLSETMSESTFKLTHERRRKKIATEEKGENLIFQESIFLQELEITFCIMYSDKGFRKDVESPFGVSLFRKTKLQGKIQVVVKTKHNKTNQQNEIFTCVCVYSVITCCTNKSKSPFSSEIHYLLVCNKSDSVTFIQMRRIYEENKKRNG